MVETGAEDIDVEVLEQDITQGQELEQLLSRAITGMKQLWTVVIVAIAASSCAFLAMGAALYIVWDDNETDNLRSCQRANSRSGDLVALTEKVQELAGGPGIFVEVDELAAFGREEFVQRDCTGDGEVTDADRPERGTRAG